MFHRSMISSIHTTHQIFCLLSTTFETLLSRNGGFLKFLEGEGKDVKGLQGFLFFAARL